MKKVINTDVQNIYSPFEIMHKIEFKGEGCTYYFNAQHKFLKLTTVERAYFDFLCENMNSRNKISFNPTTRKNFIDFCKKITSGKFVRGERTLIEAEKKFVELHLAFKDEYGKMYYINPKHVFKGSYEERRRLLLRISKHASIGKIPLEAILDVPLLALEPTDEMWEIAHDLMKMNNDLENEELGKELLKEDE